MNKKVFIIVVLAAIAAVIAAFLISPSSRRVSKPVELEQIPQKIQNEDVTVEINNEDVSIDNKADDIKEAQTVIAKPVSKPVNKPKVVNPPKKQAPVETKVKPSQEVSTQAVDNVMQSDVYKDTSTNDIVITTEYKMTSPAKYSFK